MANNFWEINFGVALPDGTASIPTLSFLSDPDTGIYRSTDNIFHLAAGGTAIAQISTTGLTVQNGVFLVPDGSVTNPSLSFTNDPDCGFYRIGTNSFGVAIAGSSVASFDSSGNFTLSRSSSSLVSAVVRNTDAAGASSDASFIIDADSATADSFLGIIGGTVSYAMGKKGGDDKFNFVANSSNLDAGNIIIQLDASALSVTLGETGGSALHTINGELTTTISKTSEASFSFLNTDNTNAAAHSTLKVTSGGTSGGDASTRYLINGSTAWATGIDNSDSDAFKISNNSTLGTNDFFKLATTGRYDLRSASNQDAVLFMETATSTGTARMYVSLGGSSTTGDAYYVAQIGGGAKWSWGLDNSDSDNLKISNGDGVGVSDALSITNSTLNVSVVAGNLAVSTAGKGLQIKEGSNAKMGTATLVAGTVTVNTTAVTANSRIFLTSQADGGTPGFVRVTARTASTSFTITSSDVADTSTIAWMLVEPA